MAPSQPSLPSHRVFVVQFRLPPTGAPARYDGRVEPLVSGRWRSCWPSWLGCWPTCRHP